MWGFLAREGSRAFYYYCAGKSDASAIARRPATPGFARFRCAFPLNDAFDALSWLASQSSLSQFYWQQRSGVRRCRSPGNVLFSSLDLAQRFYVSTRSCCIWGWMRSSEGLLLLPRLEWRRSGGRRPYAYICTVTFAAMMRARRKRFSLLWSALSLFGATLSLTSEQHWPDKDGWVKLIRTGHPPLRRRRLIMVCWRGPPTQFSVGQCRRDDGRCRLSNTTTFMAFSADTAFLGCRGRPQRDGAACRRWPGRWRTIRTIKLAAADG